MISSFGKDLKVCELGTFKGEFLDFICKTMDPKEVISIDLFEGINHSGDKDGQNIIHCNLNDEYYNLLSKYDNTNVKIVKGDVQKVLSDFPDEYFDVIYIDADHSFESVYSDLNLSYKKVKKGGVIAGHDYEKKNFFGVYLAVNRFCVEKKLLINYISKDKLPSYGIMKI